MQDTITTQNTDLATVTVNDITRDLVNDNIGYYYRVKGDAARKKFQEIEKEIVDALSSDLVSALYFLDDRNTVTYEIARKMKGNKHALKGDMWGAMQAQYFAGGGIKFVSCAGHGGFLLSEARNAAIPIQLRTLDAHYEEDCDFWIVGLVFPENVAKLFRKWNPKHNNITAEGVRKQSAEHVVRYHADAVRDLIAEVYGR